MICSYNVFSQIQIHCFQLLIGLIILFLLNYIVDLVPLSALYRLYLCINIDCWVSECYSVVSDIYVSPQMCYIIIYFSWYTFIVTKFDNNSMNKVYSGLLIGNVIFIGGNLISDFNVFVKLSEILYRYFSLFKLTGNF